MLRRLLTLIAILSLLLCVIFAGAWVRSYWIGDEFLRWEERYAPTFSEWRQLNIYLRRGSLVCSYQINTTRFSGDELHTLEGLPPLPNRPPQWSYGQGPPIDNQTRDTLPRYFGFGWAASTGPVQGFGGMQKFDYHAFWIPLWFLTLLSTILPAWRLMAWRRRRRIDHRKSLGLCPQCGYDLRASAGRCPECGAIAGPV